MTEEERLEQEKLEQEDIKQKAIDDLKEKLDKAVDPAEHAKLKADYKKLMDDYVNRRPAPKKEEIKSRPVAEIAKELSKIESGDITNREYVAKSLEYRNAHIKEYGTDPFTNFGQEGAGSSTKDTIDVADTLQKLLDENQSPVDFRIKLNSVLKDDQTLISKLRKRK
jgi:hypothetical protein